MVVYEIAQERQPLACFTCCKTVLIDIGRHLTSKSPIY